jgi:uncharacterized protein YkwD
VIADEIALIGLINMHRSGLGLEPLQFDRMLTQCARAHSRHHYDHGFFEGHVNPEGDDFTQRMSKNGIDVESSGENLAYSALLPQIVFNQWLNNPDDRANLERMCFIRIGVGKHQDAWTANFGH